MRASLKASISKRARDAKVNVSRLTAGITLPYIVLTNVGSIALTVEGEEPKIQPSMNVSCFWWFSHVDMQI